MKHLHHQGFPAIRWLRTPDAHELKVLDPEGKPEKRLLIIYYTTLFPAIVVLCREYGSEGVMVMEDTCILHEVDYAEVCREI